MSSVFRAVHVETGHEVALKVLTRTLARHATLLQRFLRQAQSAEQLEHPNIVVIYDRGIDQGRHYLALEYIQGGDLHEYVQRRGPLSAAEAVSVVKSVAGGLKFAAGRGLIHRDVKPSNLLRTESGLIKIIDLGLALHNEAEDERVTREGTTVGTVDYMAPEQARDSRATSILSDIYSLGCTFYYLLTGVPPFPGGDITDKLTRHAKTPQPNVCELRPDVPAAVGPLIMRMMAKRPDDRFASYDDLLAALDAVPLEGADSTPGIALAPLSESADFADGEQDGWGHDEPAAPSENGSHDSPLLFAPLAELIDERPPERATSRVQSVVGPRVPADDSALTDLGAPGLPEIERSARPHGASSATAWMIAGALIGFAFVIMVLGLFQYMESGGVTAAIPGQSADPGPEEAPPRVSPAPIPSARPAAAAGSGVASSGGRGPSTARVEQPLQVEAPWVEPANTDPVPTAGALRPDRGGQLERFPGVGALGGPRARRRPVCGRAPRCRLGRSGGRAVAARRARWLHRRNGRACRRGPALDRRLARSRRIAAHPRAPGCRPILHIERTTQDAVREQPAVFVLERKNLTLDGIDIVVDVSELSKRQSALFACWGANLTLRNCTITVLNPGAAPFHVISVNPSAARASRVRLERTLVRGHFTAAVAMAGGSTDLVVEQSLVLGSSGPLVTVRDAGRAVERRLFFSRSVLAGPGPIIERTSSSGAGSTTRPLVCRARGSAFGRLHGTGWIASVIASSDSKDDASKQVDWAGDNNVFAGWKGFFACGSDPVRDRARPRGGSLHVARGRGAQRRSRGFLAAAPRAGCGRRDRSGPVAAAQGRHLAAGRLAARRSL